ncbi:MAG: hypothetical protein JSU08_16855 [Acidobacteria bacterium]|nr:hypothetical protein [Acidobacteriota bacterium]
MTVTVLTIPRADLPLAELMLPRTGVRLMGKRRVHFLYSTDKPVAGLSFRDVDGTPLVECRSFDSEADARRWCAEQEVQ